MAVDHVIVAVHDLGAAARRCRDQYDLASVEGGRHPGHGTGNRIIPLGRDYIELMAVVDGGEASSSPLGSWLTQRLSDAGEGPVGLCLRTDDIQAVARRAGRAPLPMSRTRPTALSLTAPSLRRRSSEGLPFFIQWHVDDADHPGREHVEHGFRNAVGIDWAELGADSDRPGGVGWAFRSCRFAPWTASDRAGVAVAITGGEPIVIGEGATR